MTVSDRLLRLLASRGLSISEAAARARMGSMHVWRIVTGKTRNPGILTVERIVKAAGSSIAELYADDAKGAETEAADP